MSQLRPIKLVVTNEGALRRLYGKKVSLVHHALRDLCIADRRRGLDTRVVHIDVARDMSRYKARRVTRHLDERSVKNAIDDLCATLQPLYVLILGGPDVVPQQTMTRGIDTTDDKKVPSDLPYACDAPYSPDATAFVLPTRLVGRLPGITGDHDPAALVSAIRFATYWRPRARKHYDRPLAVSVHIWQKATAQALEDAFGSSRGLQLVPPKTFRWTKTLISRRAHYLNCHGIDRESEFEGQYGNSYPLAHTATYVAPRIREGTVAAMACCYGAQLYDPRRAGSDPPMINAYLRHGAYTYFGSSTSVWGEDFVSANGDLLCQLFFRHIRTGVSAGRAALEARQEYLATHSPPDPMDLLTLSQFGLFGDPSVHPILPAGLTCPESGRAPVRVFTELLGREVERTTKAAVAPMVALSAPATFEAAPKAIVHGSIVRRLHAHVEREGGSPGKIKTFTLKPMKGAGGGLASPPTAPRAVHAVSSEVGKDARGRVRRILVIAEARGQRVVSVRVLRSKG